jgi:hypothetical protein
MKLKPTLAALGLSLLLAACGDSPQDVAAPAPPPATTGDVPNTALVTATAYSQFAASLVKTETGKPLEVNGVVPPTSETDAPIPVL